MAAEADGLKDDGPGKPKPFVEVEERDMLHGEQKNNDTCFGYLAENDYFNNTTLLVIVFNALWICIDVEWNHTSLRKEDGTLPLEPVSTIVEQLFCFYFTGEVVIRFIAFRRKVLIIYDYWFLFDSMLVLFMVVETWLLPLIGLFMDSGSPDGALSSFSSFRLLRLLRLTRMARIMRFFPELMALVKGMISAAKAVFFVLVFLILITYVFAILFTSELGPQAREAPPPEEGADPTGLELFSDLGSSMMSLFTRGVLGDNLAQTLQAIKEESLLLMWAFIIFMIISGMTLLNMLIGVLCSVVEETSKQEEEEMLAFELRSTLQETFRAADTSQDGMVSSEEWEHIRNKEEVRNLLERMGVEPKEMEQRLDQMRDALFGQSSAHEAALLRSTSGIDSEDTKTRRSRSMKRGVTEGLELTFDDFVGKVLELRMDVPASALDIELCKAQASQADKMMTKTLVRIEENLTGLIAQTRANGGPVGAMSVDKIMAPLGPPPTGAAPPGAAADAKKGASEAAPAWLKEVPTELLFHALKSRSLASQRPP